MKKKVYIFKLLLFFILAIPLVAFAGQVTITLEWDLNTETYLAGYKAYVGDAAGGPYVEFSDIKEPVVTIDYVYDAPDGVATTKYFIVTAYRESPFLESGNSNEVFMIYDFAPIVAATNFAAALDGDVITFTGTGYEPFLIIKPTNPRGVFSENSNQVDVTIDKRELGPVYNLTIKVKAE